MSSSDEDDDLSRQKTVLANADQMAREHSARREIRLREERVRRLAKDESSRRRRPASGQKAGRSQPRAKSPSGSEPKKASGSEPKRASDSEPKRRAPPEERSDEGRSGPKLSDPFPPLGGKKKGQSSSSRRAPGPATGERAPPGVTVSGRSGPAPARSAPGAHSGPYRQIGPGPSATDQLAMELEELVRRFRLGWKALRAGDKITVGCAVMVIAGVLMPWVSTPGRPLEPGLFVGGLVHLAIAVVSLSYVARAFEGDFAYSAVELARRRSRQSLYIVLLGALSTIFGAYLLVTWGAQKSVAHPVEVHFGLYFTLACGTGLSYGGLARFNAKGPR